MVSSMHKFKINILSIILTLFIASLIIFDLSHNVIYSNMLNMLLWMFFIFFILIKKNNSFPVSNFSLAYLAFTIFSLSSIFWAVDFDLAYVYSLRMFIVSVNLLIVYILFVHYKVHNAVLYGILLGALYNYLIAFNIISVNYEIYEFGRFLGSVGNSNKLAKVMLLSLFASLVLLSFSNLKMYMRIYLNFSIFLSIFMIFLTVSKKAIILAPLLLLSTISFKNIKIKNILILLSTLLIVFELLILYIDPELLNTIYDLLVKRFSGLMDLIEGKTGDASSVDRKKLLVNGLDAFANNPLFGNGVNNFRLFFGKYAHNNYIELLVGVGLFGTVLFYSIYVFIIRNIYKMNASILKRYFSTMILILLIMDLATVSYFNKLVLFTLLYIYYVASLNADFKVEDNE